MFDSFGRRVSTSIAIARNVLTSDTASAPASSAAFAIALMSVTFGVSFGMTGQPRGGADGGDDIGGAVQAASERDAAFLDVRARDVQLERGDPFDIGQDLRELDVLLQRRAADVDDDHRAARAQLGHLLRDEAMDADALQADRVQHAGRRFDDARRRMSFALGEKQPLHGDAAERREVDQLGVLGAVPETAARRDERILERERCRCELTGPCLSAITTLISLPRNTGPARHDRTKCGFPSGVFTGITQL